MNHASRVLLPALLFCLFSLAAFAQTSVTGRVLNSSKEPLAGATVQVRGTTDATQSGGDGTFKLTTRRSSGTLIITAVGFAAQQLSIPVGGDLGDVAMVQTQTTLNDVVVTGYTTQRKKDITGAVTIVDVKSMKSVPGANPDQLLQGQASGVQVISSGQPGANSQINIRGMTSFGNNDPLYIIDGVQGSLHDVNPNDIESIQVLKDAGSAAIYGVKGANGVVVVTTRHGRPGKSTVSYDGWVGTQRPLPGNPFHQLSTPEMMQLTQMVGVVNGLYGSNYTIPDYSYSNNGTPGVANQGDAAVDPSNYRISNDHSDDYLIMKLNKGRTDWFHEAFKPAFQQSHNISVAGGSEKSTFMISMNYTNQDGTMLNNYLRRYSVRVNASTTVRDHLRIGENAYVFYKKDQLSTNQWESSPVSEVYTQQPMIPVYDIKGNYAGTWDVPDAGSNANVKAALDRSGTNSNNTYGVVGNAFAELDFLRHFTIRTSAGGTLTARYMSAFTYTPYENKESHNLSNAYTEASAVASTLIWTNTLQYSNVFGQNHSLKVLVGSENNNYKAHAVQGSGTDLSADLAVDPNYWSLANVTNNFAVANTIYGESPYPTQSGIFSLFGRVDYAFKDKYLLTAIVRRDQASVLLKEFQTGYFPSVSVGWRISNEEFMKTVTWVNDLKLRGSWGKLGSVNNINQFNPYNLYGQSRQSSYYDITGSSNTIQQGYLQTYIANEDTKWEQDVITNIGLDGTLFNNKLDFSLEWFRKEADGLLVRAKPPAAGVGYANYPKVNSGNIVNQGIDIGVGYHQNITRDLKLNIGLSFTHYKSTVTKLANPGYFDAGGSRQGQLVRNRVGQPFGAFYGYKVVGIYQSQDDIDKSPKELESAPGRFKYADINGDDTITSADKTTIGNPNPKFTYGLNLNLTWRSWDLSMFFNGSYGNDVYNETKYWTDFYASFLGGKSDAALYGSWTPTRTNAKTPIQEITGHDNTNNTANTYFIEKGSFLKCKSLILGYTVPENMLRRVGIDRFRIYAQVVNLFTATKYSGLDPELLSGAGNANPDDVVNSSFGIDYGNYPNNERRFVLGINLSF